MNREQTTELLLETPRFNVERVSVPALDNASTICREVVRHPGAVVILPIATDGRICLIKNYRLAINQEILELPAGTREEGELPIETAERELAEETGFRCETIDPLCDFWLSPGILDEHMFAFVAQGLKLGSPSREHGEEMENVLVAPAGVDALIKDRKIRDSKTLSVLLYYLRYSS